MTESVFGPEYPKINTVFKRDMENGSVIILDQFSSEEFEYLLDAQWTWTEKVDGTNVRLHYNGDSVTAGGRTDAAQTPGHLIYALAQYNNPAKWNEVFPLDPEDTRTKQKVGDIFNLNIDPRDITIYGEGYGPKIQNGGRYSPDVRFIVFDVRVGRWWLRREDVNEIANQFGMAIVPIVARCSLRAAISMVKEHAWAGVETLTSHVAQDKTLVMEGLVGTPSVPLFDRRGSRIIAKLKVKDFEALAKRESRRATQIAPGVVGIA